MPYAWSWQLAPANLPKASRATRSFPSTRPGPTIEEDAGTWLQRTVDYWQRLIDGAAKIEVPCRKATEALLAAHVCQLIANDHGEVHGGEGFYDEFYIRDGAYQVMELEEAGFADAAAKAIERYLIRQRADGRFESQENQFDANGQAVWTLVAVLPDHRRSGVAGAGLSADAPRRGVDHAGPPQAPPVRPSPACCPPAPADGEFLWDGKHHIVGYDLWNLRGMLCTADAADDSGQARTTRRQLLAEAARVSAGHRRGVEADGPAALPAELGRRRHALGQHRNALAHRVVRARRSARGRPAASSCARSSAAGSSKARSSGRAAANVQAIHPYMSAYTTMTDLVRGEHEQVVEDFYWYLLHSTAAHAFPEGIFYKRRLAWSDTIPARDRRLQLRHHAAPHAGPRSGRRTAPAVRRARLVARRRPGDPRRTLADALRRDEPDRARHRRRRPDQFRPAQRNPPRRIVLTLPKSRPLVGSLAGVQLVERTDQRKRWDFPAVVALYHDTYDWAKPNVVSLSTGKPASVPTRCLPFPLNWRMTVAATTPPGPTPVGIWWRLWSTSGST